MPSSVSPLRARIPHPLSVLVVFIVSVLGTALAADAQGGRVELEVSDLAGKKAAEVAVTVKDASGATVAEGETNKKGKLELTIKKAGTYEVVLEKSGLATRTIQVEITDGMSTAAAVSLLDQATADKQAAVEAFNQGVSVIQGGNGPEALVHFREASTLDPTLADAHRLVALIETEQGNLEAGAEALQQYLTLVPDGLRQAAPAAYDIYRASGQTDKLPEVRGYMRELGAHTDYAIKVFNEGVAALKDGKKDQAIALFTESKTLDPEMTTAYRSLGALHFNDKEYAQAEGYLRELLRLTPTHAEGHRLLFFALTELGKSDEAAEIAKAWLKLDGDATAQLLELAEKQFKANQTDKAKNIAEMVLAADDSNGPAHYLQGRILAQQGKIADAKAQLQRFLELSPNHAEAEAARQMLAGL